MARRWLVPRTGPSRSHESLTASESATWSQRRPLSSSYARGDSGTTQPGMGPGNSVRHRYMRAILVSPKFARTIRVGWVGLHEEARNWMPMIWR
jgi:hypothetical protein